MPISENSLPTPPRVAAVVIGRNEAAHLAACIASIRAADYPQTQIEVLYADSESTDGSPGIAERAGAQVLQLTGAPRNAARGRNAGWRAASAPFVLFLDGDVTLQPHFLARSLPLFADPGVVAVSGVLRELHPHASIYNRVFDLDWVVPPGEAASIGGIALVRRDALERAGGYNENLPAGEEPELSRRMRSQGGRILVTAEPMALHDLAMTRWSQYWGRMVRTGRAYAQVSGMYAATDDPLWLRESRANVRRGVVFLLLPVVTLLACLVLLSWWPLWLALAGLLALALRTTWRAGQRTRSITTMLLYGIHAHFQQIPILLGQWSYWRSAKKRKA